MDRFKKKPLKFSGIAGIAKGSTVRMAERNSQRKSFRQTLHSVQRNINIEEEEPEKVSKVGIPKATRLDMLRKWQEEKQIKKKMEQLSKKPAFKVGASLKPPLSAQGLQALEQSRKYPSSKLAEITHPKDKTAESETKESVKKSGVPSFKPQIARLPENKVKTVPIATNTRPQSSLVAKNQQTKPKPVSRLPIKNIKSKVSSNKPQAEKPIASSEEPFSCHLSQIEPEKSFAPPNYKFRAPKIRNSWIDDDGPCAILSRVKKEMETKIRTSTPLKKQEPIESGTDTSITGETSNEKSTPLKNPENDNSSIAGESADKKDYSTIPCSDTKYIMSLINSSEAHESEAALDSKSADDKEVSTEPVSSEKEETPLLVTSGLEKENVPAPESSVKEASGRENKDPAISPVKVPQYPCGENAEEDSFNVSVFLPAEPAPEKSLFDSIERRVTRSTWRREKPSLALISESPEALLDTPKSRPRVNTLPSDLTTLPRRSMRLARKREEEEENILDVQACFLDSPSVDAATRMSMASSYGFEYDFEKLHLEPKDGAAQSNGSTSTSRPDVPSRIHNRKVSLLYTPPRQRQSARIKSLKEDLMTFSPNS